MNKYEMWLAASTDHKHSTKFYEGQRCRIIRPNSTIPVTALLEPAGSAVQEFGVVWVCNGFWVNAEGSHIVYEGWRIEPAE